MIAARALDGIPEIRPGDDLGALLRGRVQDGDVLVIAHKAVSKAEGRVLRLADVVATPEAERLAREHGKDDPRHVQVVLDESAEILRAERGVFICRTRQGFVCANAGVDASNAEAGTVVLLPEDPDASARRLRGALGARAAVIVADSFGRAGQFVGHAYLRGAQLVAVGVRAAAVIDKRLYSGHAYCDVGLPDSPRPSEGVAYDDCYIDVAQDL